jgi:N-acetylglucosaminyl-diphospho-decaprenol L-rhamnosyltransferase
MTNLAIVVVSWNTRDLLGRCIETVHASLAESGIAYSIVVVDNASSDGTPGMLRAEYPEVELIEAGANLGFAGGNNLALRRVLSSELSILRFDDSFDSKPDYAFLLNPDTEIVGDAIPQLARYLDTHPDVAAIGPQLRYPDGSVQSSRRRFPTPGVFFWESTPLEKIWLDNPWARRYRYADTPDGSEQEVDWLVGAALMVRRAAIERAGLLDAGFLMYSEELEWQRRISGQGSGVRGQDRQPDTRDQTPIPQRIVFFPSATIIHHEGQSSEQAPARRYLNFQRSRIRDAEMTYGARFAAALRLFLRAAYAAELAFEACKWLLGHKRELRARRVRVFWQVLREL